MTLKKSEEPPKDAKKRLLEAAAKTFATHGFEGASTRMLAKEASVNISAIPYYFGSKEGLYEALIRHIISIIRQERGEKAQEITKALNQEGLTVKKATALLHEFIGGFAEFLLSNRASPHMAQILIREQMQPSPAFEIFYGEMMKPMHETLTQLVAYLTNLPPDSKEAVLCTHSIFGQLVIFKTHKEFMLRRMGWKAYGPAETKEITTMILQNTDAIIAAHRKKTP